MVDRVARATVVELLGLTLGEEKAQAAWADALRAAGVLDSDLYPTEQALGVLQVLASSPGTTGLAARLATLRLTGGERRGNAPDDAPEPSSVFRRAALKLPPEKSSDGPRDKPTSEHPPGRGVDLKGLLAPSLGEEKAREAVAEYAKTLGLSSATLSRADAVTLLEAMSRASGLLGVVARFAKVRLLLKGPDDA
jgi:hypothetical protein